MSEIKRETKRRLAEAERQAKEKYKQADAKFDEKTGIHTFAVFVVATLLGFVLGVVAGTFL